ncbi:MAG: F0F1 ATP synthase subunit B family protein, partial [Tsuneonella sp.]
LSQLALVYQSQWFWLLLVLGAIYFFIGRGIVPKVEETVDQRDAKIAADLAQAERLRAEADQTEEAWRARMNTAHGEAQAKAAAAREAAAADAAARVAAADKQLAAQAEQAEAALATARAGALAEIEGVAAEAARQIVAKLTGEQVDEAAAQRAVAGALSRA